MCGIVGMVGKGDVTPWLVEGLKRLEYRGYDSAGVAVLVDGHIERRRAPGKLSNLEERLAEAPMSGATGIGHTRWATHGGPTEANAHPHATRHAAVVHNGIIENFRELRQDLLAEGHVFESETDTETVVQLISHYLERGDEPEVATEKALKRLIGAFALGIIFAGHQGMILAARRGSPLALGYGDGETYLGSDALALAPLTRRVSYLADGDWAILTARGGELRNQAGQRVDRQVRPTALPTHEVDKGGHRHFMHKEIHEQPQVVAATLRALIDPAHRRVSFDGLPFQPESISALTIVACGTSYYAGLVARYWIEQLARIPVQVEIASEFRYRAPHLVPGGLALFISQSGETADTLAALRYCRQQDQRLLAIVNVPESSLSREADATLATMAGPEIGVASTKAFTAQLIVLAAIALRLARRRGGLPPAEEERLTAALADLPDRMSHLLAAEDRLITAAAMLRQAHGVLYLGRGTSYPIALEGALKLKEIGYIHAEGHAAGEMKHGPIALIDDQTPVVVIAPSDALFEKMASNLQEVMARGGRVVLISDRRGIDRLGGAVTAVETPEVDPFVAPILHAIPVQLLAYHVARANGLDVDQPRNLAKSVTVE